MKNFVERVIILGMAILGLTLHSMMVQEIHTLERDKLKYGNPLLNMTKLSISPRSCFQGHGEFFYKNKLHADKGLPLVLAAIKFLKESDPVKGEKTLKTIKDAVIRGIPLESKYYLTNGIDHEDDFNICHSQKPVSTSRLIKDWCKKDFSIDKIKQGALESTILQGQQERLDGIPNKLIVSSMRSADEKKIAYTRQAEQKCLKEQQSQPALLNKSLGGGNAYQIISCSLKKLLQWCTFWSKIE